MRTGELFDSLQLRQPLSAKQRKAAIDDLILQAHLGHKYFYTLYEACAVLHVSYDEMVTLIHFYKLDAVSFRGTYRVSWWAIAEYLLDVDDDIEEALGEYIRSRYRPS
jgi:hypothetical protein